MSMAKTTRAQRVAIKHVFDRGPIYLAPMLAKDIHVRESDYVETYRGFRRRVFPTFGCDGAVTVKWHGMWLAIERDGYVHS